MRLLSESLSASKALNQHTNFSKIKINNTGDIKRVVLSRVWSPIVWENGRRGSSNFQFSDYCGLDFDDTISIDEAIGIFKDYRCIIATTENHRKWKNGVYADRYRVVVPWERRITNRDEYVYNMALVISAYTADAACKDAGRLFKPSREVVFTNDGELFSVQTQREEKRLERRYDTKPLWLLDMIARGSDGESGRNVAAFKLAAACTRCSVSPDETLSILQNSFGIDSLSDRELRAVVVSAQKACGQKPPGNLTANK